MTANRASRSRRGNSSLVNIRDAVPGDARWISALIKEFGYEFDPNAVLERIQTIESDSRSRAFVAALASGIVGVLSVVIFAMFEEAGNVARITSLIVTKGAREHGIGKRLVEAAEQFARDNKCGKIEVTDSEYRRRGAAAFYESLGYDTASRRFEKRL